MGKKLVIDVLIYKRGKAFGYQEYMFNLLDYFYQNYLNFNFEEIILATSESEKSDFECYSEKFSIKTFDCSSKIKHLKTQMFLEKKLNLKKTDVVLYTYNYSSWLKKAKHILVIHDLLFLRKKLLPNTFMRLQRKIWLPISIKKADKIVAISNFTKEDIENNYKYSQNKISVIYNYFNFSKYEGNSSLERPSKPYFLSICSTAYHKNTIAVLKAFELYAKDNDEIDLCLVGALVDYNSETFKYYDSMSVDIKNRIHLYKGISNVDLAILYENATFFILLTLFEGLGMPIVEALYFNVPLLLSDIEICREASLGYAYYVNPFNYKEVANILANKKNWVKKETRNIVLDIFSKKETSGKYIEIINSLAK